MESKGIKVISSNKRAFHEYTISDKFEAGIALQGTEVKALRDGRCNLSEGWVELIDDGAMLRDAHIGHYSHGNIMNHAETRTRRLLLHQSELKKLTRAVKEKGFALIPLKIYFKGSFIKVEIGLGKGKKLHDKRQASKDKDAKRDLQKHLKDRRQ